MKVFVQDNAGRLLCTRIDDPYLMQFEFSEKSFVEPCSAVCFEIGLCYDLKQGDEYKITDGTELTALDADVQTFCALITGLERLPHAGFVLDHLRNEADKVAFVKAKHPSTKNKKFWKHKREYWPWYLEKAVGRAAAI